MKTFIQQTHFLAEVNLSLYFQDVLVPWKLKPTSGETETKTFKRYYHVFEVVFRDISKLIKAFFDVNFFISFVAH
jgi:hypothetical protein